MTARVKPAAARSGRRSCTTPEAPGCGKAWMACRATSLVGKVCVCVSMIG
jgi:hypothetical protein